MRFTLRLAENTDLDWCAATIRDGFQYHPELRALLPRLWAELLDADAMTMVLVLDDFHRTRVAFGAAVIVSDEFVQEPSYGRDPYVAVRLLQRERGGQSPYILRPEQIRAINCPEHGVNLCVLHYVENVPGLTHELARPVRDKAVSALVETQSGFAAKRMCFELFGRRDDVAYAERMGVNIRTEYSAFFQNAGSKPPPEDWPFLGELTRQEAEQQWGSPVSALFSYSPPVIFFSPMQLRVLHRSYRGHSDHRIANDSNLAPVTIREHWKAIFNRVLELQRQGVFREPVIKQAGVAGQRYDLFHYLQQHPEELRPVHKRCPGKSRR